VLSYSILLQHCVAASIILWNACNLPLRIFSFNEIHIDYRLEKGLECCGSTFNLHGCVCPVCLPLCMLLLLSMLFLYPVIFFTFVISLNLNHLKVDCFFVFVFVFLVVLQQVASWDMRHWGSLAGSNVLLCQHRLSGLVSKGW
jgi:hypothetical protein